MQCLPRDISNIFPYYVKTSKGTGNLVKSHVKLSNPFFSELRFPSLVVIPQNSSINNTSTMITLATSYINYKPEQFSMPSLIIHFLII